LLIGEAVSVPISAPSDRRGQSRFELDFKVLDAFALKGTYVPKECTTIAGTEIRVTLPKRLFRPPPKPGRTYYLRYSMYENMCPGGGACRAEWYTLISRAQAAKLRATGI
jgi:hypothetical protein